MSFFFVPTYITIGKKHRKVSFASVLRVTKVKGAFIVRFFIFEMKKALRYPHRSESNLDCDSLRCKEPADLGLSHNTLSLCLVTSITDSIFQVLMSSNLAFAFLLFCLSYISFLRVSSQKRMVHTSSLVDAAIYFNCIYANMQKRTVKMPLLCKL